MSRSHAGRADWFAAQARAYGGSRPGVADECRQFAAWHRARADEYRRSCRYDHEAEMKQHAEQTLRADPVDPAIAVDFHDRRRAA